MTCIGTLKPVLGQQWNSAWNAAGFIGGSLAVPANPQPMLQLLRGYYEANPTQEVANVNGWPARRRRARRRPRPSRGGNGEQPEQHGCRHGAVEFQEGMTTARTRASGLLAELGQLLDDKDPRWLAFGFELPGHTIRRTCRRISRSRRVRRVRRRCLPLGRCAARGRLPGGVGECRG